jgi:hypothetical protein
MSESRDYLGRSNGEGDSPEQKQSIADNVEALGAAGQTDVQTDAPLGQQPDDGDDSSDGENGEEQSGR